MAGSARFARCLTVVTVANIAAAQNAPINAEYIKRGSVTNFAPLRQRLITGALFSGVNPLSSRVLYCPCPRPPVALGWPRVWGISKMRVLGIVALCAVLGGCATKYQEMGFTQAAGGAYFQIVSAGDASRASTFVTPGNSTTTVVGNQAFTTTSPGSVDTVIKPGQDVYIRILKAAPTAPTPGVYSAAEIIQFTGPRVQRPS
jgi:hypothetical protein